jgi:hypothetical protein
MTLRLLEFASFDRINGGSVRRVIVSLTGMVGITMQKPNYELSENSNRLRSDQTTDGTEAIHEDEVAAVERYLQADLRDVLTRNCGRRECRQR